MTPAEVSMRQRIRRQAVELRRLNTVVERQGLYLQRQAREQLDAWKRHEAQLKAAMLCPRCTRRRAFKSFATHWRYRVRGWIFGYSATYKYAYERGLAARPALSPPGGAK